VSTRAGLCRTIALPLAYSPEQGVAPNYGSPDYFRGGHGSEEGREVEISGVCLRAALGGGGGCEVSGHRWGAIYRFWGRNFSPAATAGIH
jgi:hypothetical protein